jgi:hypothetical protein
MTAGTAIEEPTVIMERIPAGEQDWLMSEANLLLPEKGNANRHRSLILR